MNEKEPMIVKGEDFLELLTSIRIDTLAKIRLDLGEMTFANADLIRVIEKEISNREKRAKIAKRDTIEVGEPDFGFED